MRWAAANSSSRGARVRACRVRHGGPGRAAGPRSCLRRGLMSRAVTTRRGRRLSGQGAGRRLQRYASCRPLCRHRTSIVTRVLVPVQRAFVFLPRPAPASAGWIQSSPGRCRPVGAGSWPSARCARPGLTIRIRPPPSTSPMMSSAHDRRYWLSSATSSAEELCRRTWIAPSRELLSFVPNGAWQSGGAPRHAFDGQYARRTGQKSNGPAGKSGGPVVKLASRSASAGGGVQLGHLGPVHPRSRRRPHSPGGGSGS
jgi:hypothetical protein